MTTINAQEYAHVAGVKLPDPGIPEWKANMLQEKNIKIITEYLGDQDAKRKEEERWKSVPDWKKSLMLEKEKKKKDEQREQEESGRRERDKFEKLPEWRKQLLTKKLAEQCPESSQPSESGEKLSLNESIDGTTTSEMSSQLSEDGEEIIPLSLT